MDESVEAFKHRLLQICHVLRQGKKECLGVGSYALESFNFANGVLQWALSMSNVKLEIKEHQVNVGGVDLALRYTAGGRVMIDSIYVDEITNLPKGLNGKAFSDTVRRKSRSIIQDVIDSAGGRP